LPGLSHRPRALCRSPRSRLSMCFDMCAGRFACSLARARCSRRQLAASAPCQHPPPPPPASQARLATNLSAVSRMSASQDSASRAASARGRSATAAAAAPAVGSTLAGATGGAGSPAGFPAGPRRSRLRLPSRGDGPASKRRLSLGSRACCCHLGRRIGSPRGRACLFARSVAGIRHVARPARGAGPGQPLGIPGSICDGRRMFD
jgi:hypothetical protein